MSNEDLEACFKLVQDVARKAGEVILFVHHRLFFMHPAFHDRLFMAFLMGDDT